MRPPDVSFGQALTHRCQRDSKLQRQNVCRAYRHALPRGDTKTQTHGRVDATKSLKALSATIRMMSRDHPPGMVPLIDPLSLSTASGSCPLCLLLFLSLKVFLSPLNMPFFLAALHPQLNLSSRMQQASQACIRFCNKASCEL